MDVFVSRRVKDHFRTKCLQHATEPFRKTEVCNDGGRPGLRILFQMREGIVEPIFILVEQKQSGWTGLG